ncbi:MAG: VWA domain-containing protein [Inquilinus limosus]|uniref:VWA domain-containing protein n=1 Tax=Inquilinus limosus TaxID=171674 RepID=A0A952FR12_9PROT|nr:VWA domain-containing protein [Inquilinus limosus]
MPRRLRFAAALLLVLVPGALPAGAQTPAATPAPRQPLLMEGTTTLQQRVLTRPGARLAKEAGGDPAGAELPPLSVMFVYARVPSRNGVALEIGPTADGRTLGWIPVAQAIDWKQTLVVAFTNPVNRDRALFFDESDALLSLMEDPTAGFKATALRQAAEGGKLPADSHVTAIEPPRWIDPAKTFYLLPILNWTNGYFASGFNGLALQVAATSLQERPDAPAPSPQPAQPDAAVMAGYRAGVVFVVDTTISMDPYVERTRDTIRALVDKLWAKRGNALRFGLVGFRDVLKDGTPDEYTSRVFADLPDHVDKTQFLRRLDAAAASRRDNLDFSEDSFAGVKAALDDIDWSDVSGRFVVLVTDAGPRRAADRYSSTHLDPDQLRILAQSKGAALITVHLKTAAGKDDHASAEEAYRALSDYPNVGSLYFPIRDGDVRAFGAVIDRVSGIIAGQMDDAAKGQVAAAEPAGPDGDAGADADAEVFARAGLVGRAMQLAYLGRMEGGTPPRLFSAWVTDRDLADPSRKTLDVRVLITKNQLSDLQSTLKTIIDAGEVTRIAPADFFGQLRGAAATMARRPEGVALAEARRLADLGLIGEYLDGLPYRSRIMELTEDDWLSWGFGQQRQFLDDLDAKVTLYQQIYDNADLWIALDGDRTGGEAVYPIPLDALP